LVVLLQRTKLTNMDLKYIYSNGKFTGYNRTFTIKV